MKKIILSTLVAASFAASTESNARNFTGFYVGGNLGATMSKVDYSYDNNTAAAYSVESSGNAYRNNGLVSLVGGYSYLFSNCLYLGGELFIDGNFGGNNQLFSNQNISARIKKNGLSYGVLAKFGSTISENTLLYVGIGGKSDKWDYKTTSQLIPANLAIGYAGRPAVDFSQSKRSFRLLAEAGLEGYIGSTKHLTWRAAYQYVPGQSVGSTAFPVGHVLNNATGNSFAKYKSHDHTLRLGIAYHF
ncbi:outer membrane protein [Candidatus Paracaedibacter symbiosus]|uniref:outer membrane protein n=1 Tax=Candidatus Paracaedibacter symbiosus TaxID=244582 RepID=UPI0005098556|nr:outer membrane beta-barrel protein [Candidatus Paracaedibacter symbiosus]